MEVPAYNTKNAILNVNYKLKKAYLMEQTKLFGSDFQKLLTANVQFLQLSAKEDPIILPEKWINSGLNLSCSYCRVEFTNPTLQRQHCKLDWHRYNLKQSLLSRAPLTEEEFNEKTDDISSISGSDSESEDGLDNIALAQGKLFLKNDEDKVFSLYRCLLFEKKAELETSNVLRLVQDCSCNSRWTVLMLGGGHFAGGVFEGDIPILHKTFHCYTVRAGQGGSQGARDSRSGSSQPKSAGASLRRYNENALIQHVREILDLWKSEIEKSSLVIYRATGPQNRAVLFGGKTPPLNRLDPRLRSIPFSTRRATFTELKRVHMALSTINVYDSPDAVIRQLPKQEDKRSKGTNINRSKSRETVERSQPAPSLLTSSSSSNVSDLEEIQTDLFTSSLEISFRDSLQTFEDTLTPEERKLKSHKKPKKSKNKRLKEKEAAHKRELCEITKLGDLQKLEELIGQLRMELEGVDESETIKRCFGINGVLDDFGNTLLHVAAINKKVEVVKFLLDNDADPCSKNDKQQTPYSCTQDQDVRNVFKDFAQEFPDKHNYNKAQIPTTTLTPEEILEKKKAQKKVKREKEKEKRKVVAIKKQEESEKERFLNLSDREKRALAAERRILNQSGTVISRCFLCAGDISGKVPFEYSGNRFCSIQCLKAHRLQTPTILS